MNLLRYFAASKIRTSDFSISLAIFRFDFSLALANCRRNFAKCRANAAKYRSKVRRYFEENKARNSSKFVLITFAQYCIHPALGFVQLSPGVLTLSLPESIMETFIKGGSNLSLWMKSYAVTIQVKPLNPILPGGGAHWSALTLTNYNF